MDPSNLSLADDGLEVVHQNGVHEEEPSNSQKDGTVANDVDSNVSEITDAVAPNGNFELFNQLNSTATDNSSMAEIKGSNENMDGNNVTTSKEEGVKTIDQTAQLRARKGPVKTKDAKHPSQKGVHASSVKKSKDGKDEHASSAGSNGALASDSHQRRQPIKHRSFNDKPSRLSKHPGKSDAASSEEVPMDKSKPISSNKGPLTNVQGEAESSLSPTAEDAKPRRVGTLPKYGFNFKCDERAERRKQFYSKLEEKIHAKEMEESNLQAKTKETQEAEIKKLRKSLKFKATPMPSFYREASPPRMELKKIPTTRAKSPKLGRRKSSTQHSESEGNNSSSALQGRLSLDEKKVSQSKKPAKGITHIHEKKPQRRSLPPKLTSSSSNSTATARASSKEVSHQKSSLPSGKTEVTTLSNAEGEEKVGNEENNTLSNDTIEAQQLNVAPSGSDKPQSEAESHVNGDIVIEEVAQLTLVQEPIAAAAAEH